VLRLPHISNFDDFDPLEREPSVRLRYVERAESLASPDLLILPGTKTTIADLEYLHEVGLAGEVVRLSRSGTPVIGICGGYQMLGTRLRDPEGVESQRAEIPGLGLLPVETTFEADKRTCRVEGHFLAGPGLAAVLAGERVVGYEIHTGRTTGGRSAIRVDRRLDEPADDLDGSLDSAGLVLGTYLHGIFAADGVRRALVSWLAGRKGSSVGFVAGWSREPAYDRLADLVESNMDMQRLAEIIGLRGPVGVAPSA